MPSTQELVEVLLDPEARPDERDDAAMDLGSSDDQAALDALIKAASDVRVPEMVKASCGESLAEIWLRTNNFDRRAFASLNGVALAEAKALIQARAPYWLS